MDYYYYTTLLAALGSRFHALTDCALNQGEVRMESNDATILSKSSVFLLCSYHTKAVLLQCPYTVKNPVEWYNHNHQKATNKKCEIILDFSIYLLLCGHNK